MRSSFRGRGPRSVSDPPLQTPLPEALAVAGGPGLVRDPRALGRTWPLVPLVPAVVVVVGLAAAGAIGLFGVSNLARASDEHAAARAELIVSTLGARLLEISGEERLEVMQ